MENIEQSGPISGSQMLVDNAGVHHRHSIAGKFDDFSPLCFVFLNNTFRLNSPMSAKTY